MQGVRRKGLSFVIVVFEEERMRYNIFRGEINYDYLFKVIENSDYNGWVGCEYKPQTTTEAGLRWMDPYR